MAPQLKNIIKIKQMSKEIWLCYEKLYHWIDIIKPEDTFSRKYMKGTNKEIY